jgi:salicylate hydroxylase
LTTLGLWSTLRDNILNKSSPPVETGDLAYRGIFSLAQLQGLNEPRLDELLSKKVMTTWLGPNKHAVFYPVRGGKEFNLVLLRPDNLPSGVRQANADLEEMRVSFNGWDELYALYAE